LCPRIDLFNENLASLSYSDGFCTFPAGNACLPALLSLYVRGGSSGSFVFIFLFSFYGLGASPFQFVGRFVSFFYAGVFW